MKILPKLFLIFLIPILVVCTIWNLASGRHYWSFSEIAVIAGVLAFMAKPFVVWLAIQKPG